MAEATTSPSIRDWNWLVSVAPRLHYFPNGNNDRIPLMSWRHSTKVMHDRILRTQSGGFAPWKRGGFEPDSALAKNACLGSGRGVPTGIAENIRLGIRSPGRTPDWNIKTEATAHR